MPLGLGSTSQLSLFLVPSELSVVALVELPASDILSSMNFIVPNSKENECSLVFASPSAGRLCTRCDSVAGSEDSFLPVSEAFGGSPCFDLLPGMIT